MTFSDVKTIKIIIIWAARRQNQQCGCAPSEDLDQPGHPPSLIRAFAVRMKKAWVRSYPLSRQWRLWSVWAEAQADLSLCWAHTHFVGFVMRQLICKWTWHSQNKTHHHPQTRKEKMTFSTAHWCKQFYIWSKIKDIKLTETNCMLEPWSVPQGSVLGPVLFLAYINDLPDKVKSEVRLFADDTATYLAITKPAESQQLQDDLNILQDWEHEWDMVFNPSKCHVIRVTRSRSPLPTSYTLHGQTLEVVLCARYLGSTHLTTSHGSPMSREYQTKQTCPLGSSEQI